MSKNKPDFRVHITIPLGRFADNDHVALLSALAQAGFPEYDTDAKDGMRTRVCRAKTRHEPVVSLHMTAAQFSKFIVYRNKFGGRNMIAELQPELTPWSAPPEERKLIGIASRLNDAIASCYLQAANGGGYETLRSKLKFAAETMERIRDDLVDITVDWGGIPCVETKEKSQHQETQEKSVQAGKAFEQAYGPGPRVINSSNFADIAFEKGYASHEGMWCNPDYHNGVFAFELDKIETRLRGIVNSAVAHRGYSSLVNAVKRVINDIHAKRGELQMGKSSTPYLGRVAAAFDTIKNFVTGE